MREIANLRFIVLVFLLESYKYTVYCLVQSVFYNMQYILSGPIRILQQSIVPSASLNLAYAASQNFIGFHFAVRIYCN
jgi:hypothetical protein